MIPKEKAIELVEKFSLDSAQHIYAKKCALICVDEMIKSNPTNPLKGGYIEIYSDMIDEAISFWEEVKEEINKL